MFRWRWPYASLMQMRHCHRRCYYCCSAAGWPILINCKSLLVTRAWLGIRASPVHQSTTSTPVAQDQDQDRPESHGNTSAASGFSFLFFAGQRINNKNAGNKLHNTRMLSRKLVLIFKALHYSQPEPEPERGKPTEETSENCYS